MATAHASARQPTRPRPYVELDDLAFLDAFKIRRVKDGKDLTAMFKDAITSAEMEMTLEGAGTLTLTMADPEWEILESGVFDRRPHDGRLDRIDVRVDHRWFRLMQVQAQGSTVTMTCEEREVVYLRTHKKVKGKNKWRRSQHTRAEFVKRLVGHVKAGGGIDVLIYELHKKQPVARVRSDKDDGKKSSSSSTPFAGKNLIGTFDATAYGPPWDTMNGSGVTSRGVDLRPAKKAYGIAIDPDYKLDYGKNYYIWPNPFGYKGTFKAFDTGGAINGNRIDFYDWRGRKSQYGWGRKNVKVYRASKQEGGSSDGDDDGGKIIPYEFKVNRDENFWTAIQRLAQEPVDEGGGEQPLGWRGFMQNYVKHNGKLGVRFVFAAEEDLYQRGRKFNVAKDDAKVIDFSFDWDQGKKVGEASLQMLTERWSLDPGDVISFKGAGPANGRWLVVSIRRNLFELVSDISLRQPMPQQNEPAPGVEQEDNTDAERADAGGEVADAKPGSPVPGQSFHSSTHPTGNLPGYPAYDYMAPAGTPCVSPEDAKVTRLSGKDPKLGGPPGGALGYSIYLDGDSGKQYFLTHLDNVSVKVGDKVQQGEKIAEVANGPKSWSSPHVHMGVKQ